MSRNMPRYGTNPNSVRATLTGNNQSFDGSLHDVSGIGAFFKCDTSPPTTDIEYEAVITSENASPITRKAIIIHNGNGSDPKVRGIRFVRPLYEQDIAALVDGYSPRIDGQSSPEFVLAQKDYDEINEEIRAIQSCRSTIFIGTNAVVGAATMTTAVIIAHVWGLPGSPTFPFRWAMFGSSVTAVLLMVGILATIEKARAINLRKAFQAALTEYIRDGQAPPSYQGWSFLRFAQSDCGNRRKSAVEMCPHIKKYNAKREEERQNRTPVGNKKLDNPPETCWTLGKFETTKLRSGKRTVPGSLDSFMSLSGMIYAGLFTAVAGSASWFLFETVGQFWKNKTPQNPLYLKYAILAFAIGLVLGVGKHFFPKRLRRKNKQRSEVNERTDLGVKVARGITIIGLLVVVGIGVSSFLEFGPPVFRYVIFGVLAASASYLAVFLINQLKKVRKGLYSFEALYASWRLVLEDCCLRIPKRKRDEIESEMMSA